MKGLYNNTSFLLLFLFAGNFLNAEGLNITIKSGEKILGKEKLLVRNYNQINEGTDQFIISKIDSKSLLMILQPEHDTIYFLNSTTVDCAKEKAESIAITPDGKILGVKDKLELYTALDSSGEMVAKLLIDSDSQFWGEKNAFFKKETRKWVNIDFKKIKGKNFEYLLIDYSGEKVPGLLSTGSDVKEGEKESFNLKEYNIMIYQWNGDSWLKLVEIPPVFSKTSRKMAIKIMQEKPLKFRAELISGVSRIDSIMLVHASLLKNKPAKFFRLPVELRQNDKKYLKIPPGEEEIIETEVEKDSLCLLRITGYFELKKERENIPKGIDDIINRFLSRIKFW